MAGVRVTICGVNTKDLPLLSAKDKKELLTKIKAGDNSAREAFIKGNLRLVLSIVGRFSNSNENMDDLFQIGCIGLIKAIDNFDLGQGVQFSTYAVPMIVGEIKRFMRDDGMIKVSRTVKSLARKIYFCKEQLSIELNREPTIDEIAGYSGINKEDIIIAIESSSGLQYLYDTIHQDEGNAILLIDKLSEQSEEDTDIVDKIALKEALTCLDEKSRKIIMLRYFKDKTQVQVAKMLGISHVQVSRIEKKVLLEMRKKME